MITLELQNGTTPWGTKNTNRDLLLVIDTATKADLTILNSATKTDFVEPLETFEISVSVEHPSKSRLARTTQQHTSHEHNTEEIVTKQCDVADMETSEKYPLKQFRWDWMEIEPIEVVLGWR